ncbi:host-nuclease inhibitor Gam family protein [Sphingomonas silueang]|uniref:host-nuclease inhibitor Gam family protein n=1 Tax=Sphingomonas silueang TaxID=3156617 RepID=UPI0032B57F00
MRPPRTLDKATLLLERYSALAGELETIEANRNAAIADTNSIADRLGAPIVKEMDEIRAAIEPWWATAAAELTKGKRKSIELGGCVIGTRAGRAKLSIAGDEAVVTETLKAQRWAKPYLRTTTAIDRASVLAAIDGPHQAKLLAAGLTRLAGEVAFVLDRVKQAGTVASAA